MEDEIIREVEAMREKIAERHEYDVERIGAHLRDSAAYFGFPFGEAAMREAVEQRVADLEPGAAHKVRLDPGAHRRPPRHGRAARGADAYARPPHHRRGAGRFRQSVSLSQNHAACSTARTGATFSRRKTPSEKRCYTSMTWRRRMRFTSAMPSGENGRQYLWMRGRSFDCAREGSRSSSSSPKRELNGDKLRSSGQSGQTFCSEEVHFIAVF